VITRLNLTPREPPSGKFAKLHRRFTIEAPAFDGPGDGGLPVFLRFSKMASVWAIFFCGFALRTLRRRKPNRLRMVAIVLGAGTCFLGTP
jgi:hypothetical protein